MEVVGERWTLLIVREALLGVHRFDEIQADLRIARNVLQARLERMLAHGILEKRVYQERPERFEYHLTDKGLDLWPAVCDSEASRHAPVRLEHRGCGGTVDMHRLCSACGERLGPHDVWAVPADGASPDHPLRRRARRHAEPAQPA